MIETADGLQKSESAMPVTAFEPESINLNVAPGAGLLEIWDVRRINYLSIDAVLDSGTWSTAVVQVNGLLRKDATQSTTITTLTGAGLTTAIDVEPYAYINLVVSTAEGSAASATASGHGWLRPF